MFGQMKRPKARHSLSLPYASDDRPLLPDSSHHHGSRFVTIIRIPLPRFGKAEPQAGGASFYPHPPRRPVGRYVHLPLPIPPRVYARIQQLNPVLRLVVLGLGCVGFFLVISLLGGGSVGAAVPALITSAARTKTGTGSSNAVVSAEEIAKIWEWEVMSGHHPSAARGEFGFIPEGWGRFVSDTYD
jgi:WD repeat and SOF domain-containing protein 1